jgi:hypothetical protein
VIKDNDEKLGSRSFGDNGCLTLFVYNNERLLIVEENLNYFSNQSTGMGQFNLIDHEKISDIVHLVI